MRISQQFLRTYLISKVVTKNVCLGKQRIKENFSGSLEYSNIILYWRISPFPIGVSFYLAFIGQTSLTRFGPWNCEFFVAQWPAHVLHAKISNYILHFD